ncbi:hypothetical protein [Leucobacter massiliensis]|uniref:Transporter n=1 Tax=Leucobacter massiliensis TaxID=1686285 RepID=A0A2S9QMK5_9MICO|nr:hypothetical protein [Leucobacter massiliensis]PRI10820.1 hypothetical protein B4915_07950 [Leucobacter massiliensis]
MAEPLLTPAFAPQPAAGNGTSAPRSGPAARVRVLVRLRFLVLWNTLRRHPWQLVGAIIGALYGLGVLSMVTIGLVALSWADPALARTVVILGGSALILGWMVAPIVSSGMDRTLDPARLVVFPMRPGTQLAGIAIASLLGVPGIITLLVSALAALAWLRSPLAVIAALLLAPVAAASCVLACQFAITALSRLTASRRFREIIGGVIVLLVVCAGPLIAGVGSGIEAAAEWLPTVAEVLSWTPLGAVWAVPAELAAGHWLGAVLRLLIALATVLGLFLAWRPLYIAGFGAAGGSRTVVKAGTGWFGRFPATPRGAIAARTLTYWLRDPRYLQSLLIVLVMPVVFGFVSATTGMQILLPGSTVMVACLLSLATFTDVSYDGTAFSTHLVHGVRGIDDRLGRLWSNALLTVPCVLLVAVVTTAIVGRFDQLPTLLGLSGAVMLGGFGVASVASAIFVMPVPQSGENPFATKPGAGVLSMVGTFGSYGALLVLTLPTIVLTVVAGVSGDPLWAWLTLAVGLLNGGLVCFFGVMLGSRLFDRRGPELLARVVAQG